MSRHYLTSCFFLLSTFLTPYTCAQGPTVDYVVIGVGTASAVVTRLLSDDNTTSVVALYDGPNLNNAPVIKYTKYGPLTVLSTLFGIISPTINPLFESGLSIPQPDANNEQDLWVIAKPVGGATSINAGTYCRATNQNYAEWEAVAGSLWSPNRLMKLQTRLEKYNGETPDKQYRGYHGPINVRQVPNASPASLKFTQAVIAGTGFPYVTDYNDPLTTIGASSQVQYTQKGQNGKLRVSSATAFLDNRIVSKNGFGKHGRKLQILYDTFALRTIWEDNKAVGVEYMQDGELKQIYAAKGVIVCAGLRSSVFLMQSGVGSGTLLSSLNIPVVYDNPNVGQNLTDQPHVIINYTSNPKDTPASQPGIFTQMNWLPAPGGDPTMREIRIAYSNLVPGFTLCVLDLLQPKSRGSVSINSANPMDPPVIDYGWLTNSDDLTLYINAFQTYIKNINNALQTRDPLYQMVLPDPAIIDDRVALTDYIRSSIGSNMCFESHCRMAPLAQGGVVDGTGLVYGVSNLWVADNSIIPVPMDGCTMASAYLIGYNVALILLGK